MVASIGRFGPYIRHAGAFVSIPKGMSAEGITLEEAIGLIEAKRAKDAAAHIKSFPEMPGLEVINGRFGPYLAYKPEGAKKAVNYKIPKTQDAAGADPDIGPQPAARSTVAERLHIIQNSKFQNSKLLLGWLTIRK